MKAMHLTKKSTLSQEQLGGKGFNLQRLIAWGLEVPTTYVIPSSESNNMDANPIRIPTLELPRNINTRKKYAVRSSGVGEDGAKNSFAGIFDTLLDVKYSNIPEAIHKVYRSKDTSVTSMYNDARGAKVIDMAIIIQEMIAAEYAGVAFSVNPIEQDARIGLIEVVKGVGESLVSGKAKPTSIRINKITGMTRTLQFGTDIIPDSKLGKIITKVSELLWKIENLYGQPIDIEWAYKKDTVYLLQARPITTLGDEK